MTQAMPSRSDLERVYKINARTAAGYEVLLAAWHDLTNCAFCRQAFCRQAKFDLSTEAGRIAAHAAYAARAEAATAYIWKDPSKLTSAAIQLVNAWENRAPLHPDVIDEGMRCLRAALKEAAKP